MGLYPDLLPGYHHVASRQIPRGVGRRAADAGLTLPEMVESAQAGELKALYVIGSNPVGRFGIDPFALL